MKKIFINFKIIKNYLRQNWGIILGFALGLILINVLCILMNSLPIMVSFEGAPTKSFIANYNFYKHGDSSGIFYGYGTFFTWGMNTAGIALFAIFNLILVNHYIVGEVNKGHITILMASTNKRQTIIVSKIMFLISASLLVFLPSFLIVMFYGIIQLTDSNLYMGRLVTYEFAFIAFVILLMSVFVCVEQLLSDVSHIGILINILITIYTVVIYLVIKIGGLDHKWIHYLSPLILIPQILSFISPDALPDHSQALYLLTPPTNQSYGLGFGAIGWNLAISVPFFFGASYMFCKKDLAI